MEASKYCVIVDGYSAGNFLPGEFHRRGYTCIHVQSTPEIWPILVPTYHAEDYEHHFAFHGDLQAVIEQLRPFQPTCLLPGTETGVELADQLSEAMGLRTNGTARSEARRNKYLMIEAVRAHGLKAAAQLRSHLADEVLQWVDQNSFRRVVVKPVKGAGSDNVRICDSSEDIRTACDLILGHVNQLGLPNNEVLCQEFLSGTEYALDGVCLDGATHFTAVWKYHKVSVNGRHFVYDRDELVSSSDAVGTQLCDYVIEVLKAVQIRQGPFHAEVMLTADGPALVEIGARLNGTTTPDLHARCIGYGQLDLAVDAYVDPDAFRTKSAHPYQLKQYALSVALISEQEGIVKSLPGEPALRALRSFNEIRWRAKPGYHLRPTVDYFTNPAFLILVHPDRDVLHQDLALVRQLEKNGLYELETPALTP